MNCLGFIVFIGLLFGLKVFAYYSVRPSLKEKSEKEFQRELDLAFTEHPQYELLIAEVYSPLDDLYRN